MQRPDLLEYERYEAVYKTILAACKEQRGRPGGVADPQDGTVDVLSKEQLTDVAEGLFRQNTASGDGDLSWMLLGMACLSRSDDMRHTLLPHLCPPTPVINIGECLGVTDSCQPQCLNSKTDCAALLNVMRRGLLLRMRASSRSAALKRCQQRASR